MQKRSDNFDKFANKKKGSAIKEEYRQEKKRGKADARAAGEALRLKKKNAKLGIITEEPKKFNSRGPKRAPGANREEFKQRVAAGGKPNTAKPISNRTENTRPGKTVAELPTPSLESKPSKKADRPQVDSNSPDIIMPLNKFIAHSGVCGRREAAELVKTGKVSVNGDKIFEPGYKVSGKDKIIVKGKEVFLQKNSVYILMNKPKDFITTASDPQGRKTVMDIVKSATQ
jgi:23S rRNA pseudouridine2605 synthase